MNKKVKQKVAFIIFRDLSLCVVGVLLWMLGFIVYNGIGVISWDFLTTAPTEGTTAGGIFPAIAGTLCLIVGSIVFAVPVGLTSGIYISEYAKNGLIKLERIGDHCNAKVLKHSGNKQ